MDDLIASFTQSLPQSGYKIRRLETVDLRHEAGNTESRMVDVLTWPGGRNASKTYQPLEEQPALFYKFADLGSEPSSEEILVFANQYGWLGNMESVVDPTELLTSATGGTTYQNVISGELLEHWYRELNHYIPLLELWEAISAKDSRYLASVVHWHDDLSTVSYGNPGVSSMLVASTGTDKELLQSFAPGELQRPAMVALVRAVNKKLGSLCSPALLFEGRSYTDSHLYFVCENLLGVIWLQFAKAVESNIEYRRCHECSQPFIPHPGERGKKKKFCTDACKSRNYRNKRKLSVRGTDASTPQH
ncbi:MAG: hypothetical protein AAF431_03795 [Pseudomonadota bacterium]